MVRLLALFSVLAAGSVSCSSSDCPRDFGAPVGDGSGTVEIHIPDKLSSIETEAVDALGQPVRIACATCHSSKDVATMPTSPADLTAFHAGMTFAHGQMACASCHASEPHSAPELHLADGERIPMTEAMRLCAQCHGPQFRDYGHGAHGGMTGAWDLSRGSRSRNHCVDCHDPHTPRIPAVVPAEKIHDRAPLARGLGANHG